MIQERVNSKYKATILILLYASDGSEFFYPLAYAIMREQATEGKTTMAQPQMLEGTGEELQRMLAQFPNERFRLVPVPVMDAENGQHGDVAEAGSLYDLLGDYVGSVEGNGENNAARASELFTDHVVKKHNEGNL